MDSPINLHPSILHINGNLSEQTVKMINKMVEKVNEMESTKYYYLKKGEIIQEGDECEMSEKYNDPAKWVKSNEHDIGTPAPDPQYMAHRKYRRLIK